MVQVKERVVPFSGYLIVCEGHMRRVLLGIGYSSKILCGRERKRKGSSVFIGEYGSLHSRRDSLRLLEGSHAMRLG